MPAPEYHMPPPPVEKVCPKCGRILKGEWNACPDCNWTATRNKSSAPVNIAIACGIMGFIFPFLPLNVFGWYLGQLFGVLGIGLGASAVKRRDKDIVGYLGIILGLIAFIFNIAGMIFWYSYLF